MAVYSPGGASGHAGNRHGSGHLHTDGGNRHIQPGCGADFGHQVQVGIIQCEQHIAVHCGIAWPFCQSLTFLVSSISYPVILKSLCGVGKG